MVGGNKKSNNIALALATLLLVLIPVSASAAFTRPLSVGSIGEDVRELQQFLKDRGFWPLAETTTYFGTITKDALAKYQASVGLEAVGQVGPKTLALLNGSATTNVSSTITERPLFLGTRGADVSALQQFLKDKGFYTYPEITGYYGPLTEAAVKAFQLANGLEAVGYVGPQTRIKITEQLSVVGNTEPDTEADEDEEDKPRRRGGGGGGGSSNNTPSDAVPTVSITVPSDGATVSGSATTLTASASDDVSVSGVQFKRDTNTLIGSEITSSPYTLSWDTTGVSDGSHTLIAVARDSAGQYATSTEINITVDNAALNREFWEVSSSDWDAVQPHLEDVIDANSGATASASLSAMGASMTGSGNWIGGVLAENGNIYGIPAAATDILIIDPDAGTASRSAMGADLSGITKWFGGVLGKDGKIYGIPFNATDILIIDPDAGTASRSAMGATLTGSGKWWGGVAGPDGKIYGIPDLATDILIIDPDAGTATRSTMGVTFGGSTDPWSGGVLGPDGKIYGIPRDSTDILIIDPNAGTATRSAMGADLTGTDKWRGGVLGPDGKIYGIPSASETILIIDPEAGTATRSNMGATLTGASKWLGGALGSDGKIYAMNRSAGDFLVIDPEAGTATRSSLGATVGSNAWRAATLGFDGKMYGIPYTSTGILIIDFAPLVETFYDNFTLSPWVNKH